MSRGLGKMQSKLLTTIQMHGKPMTLKPSAPPSVAPATCQLTPSCVHHLNARCAAPYTA